MDVRAFAEICVTASSRLTPLLRGLRCLMISQNLADFLDRESRPSLLRRLIFRIATDH
jgi:hypothetical protein